VADKNFFHGKLMKSPGDCQVVFGWEIEENAWQPLSFYGSQNSENFGECLATTKRFFNTD
jgi:hypothetical protein